MLSKKIFLAPDIFLAFIDRAHPNHIHASAFFRFFAQEGYYLYTNTQTLIEVHKSIHDNISPSLARDFLKAISLGTVNIIYPEEADMKLTLKTLISYSSQELQMNEALMAVLASRRNISQICTFDYLHPLFGLTAFYLPI